MSGVACLQNFFFFEHRKRTPKAGVELRWQRDQVNDGRGSQCQKATNKHQQTQHGYPGKDTDERRYHEDSRAQFLDVSRGPDEVSPQPQRAIVIAILQSVADFMRRHSNRSQ